MSQLTFVSLLYFLVCFLVNTMLGCTDKYNYRRFFRRACDLIEVPDNIPPQAKEVHLGNNRITTIPNTGLFKNLSDCSYVHLFSNQIGLIEPGSFVGLKSVKSLSLQDNCLSVLKPGMFWGLTKLATLSLWSNKIVTIEPGALLPLSSLQCLFLKANLLHSITFSMLEGLRELQQLSLDNNVITKIEKGSFDHLCSLQSLSMNGNLVKTLSPDLLINVARPKGGLDLSFTSRDSDPGSQDCRSLCWFKSELHHKTMLSSYFDRPSCAEGQDWDSLQCDHLGQGKCLQFV